MSKPSTSGSLILFFIKFLVLVTVLVWLWWTFVVPPYTALIARFGPVLLEAVYDTEVEGRAYSWEDAPWGGEEDLFNTKHMLAWYPEGWPAERRPPYMFIALLVTNVPPFLALVLATPALGLWRRVRILLIGTSILVAAHLTFIVYAYRFVNNPELSASGIEISQAAAEFFLTLPFLLWIVLAYWHKLGAYFSSAPAVPLDTEDSEVKGAKLLPDGHLPKNTGGAK